jgi:hypothetical protein
MTVSGGISIGVNIDRPTDRSAMAPWVNELSEGLRVEDIETTHSVMSALRSKLEGNRDA